MVDIGFRTSLSANKVLVAGNAVLSGVGLSRINGVLDTCNEFRGSFGSAARSKLHEDFVKKLSPHFHWFVSAISSIDELIDA